MTWRSTCIHESLAKIFFAFLRTIFYRCRKHCLRAQLYIGPDRSQTYDEPWVIHDMIFILHSYIDYIYSRIKLKSNININEKDDRHEDAKNFPAVTSQAS